jgi:hypothetical protein
MLKNTKKILQIQTVEQWHRKKWNVLTLIMVDILKYKGKLIKKNSVLIEKHFFTFCLLLLTFIFIKCKLQKKNWYHY